MCEHIDYDNFVQFAYPSLKRIATELKQRHPDIPLLGFARDAPYGIEWLQMAGRGLHSSTSQLNVSRFDSSNAP
jgi:uroporphyrinogen decarboxylase